MRHKNLYEIEYAVSWDPQPGFPFVCKTCCQPAFSPHLQVDVEFQAVVKMQSKVSSHVKPVLV